MIKFMVIALPRSGTTWAANWLTTNEQICVHDPLYTTHYSEWDIDKKRFPHGCGCNVGIACTGIFNWSDWLNQHPARKVILHRDYREIVSSMSAIGLDPIERSTIKKLDKIIGLHVPYTDLFDSEKAREIWHYLTDLPFNISRHKELVNIEMQPKFSGLSYGKEVTAKLRKELYEM